MKALVARTIVASALTFVISHPLAAQSAAGEVMRADEAFRLAKLHRDIQTLDRVLAEAFNETNQNGNSRDKAQMLDLWKGFSIGSLTTDTFTVRQAGDTAMVTGTQTEDGDHMLFTRVYIRRAADWQLLASMQFRDPNRQGQTATTAQKEITLPPGVEGEVMRADEALRLAKLHRDTGAISRLLAEGFNETNQNGNSRDKAQMIELFKTFEIDTLTTDTFQVRVVGNTASVTGTQTEDQTEHMLFTRVYVNGPNGWQLLASMQFRNPHINGGL